MFLVSACDGRKSSTREAAKRPEPATAEDAALRPTEVPIAKAPPPEPELAVTAMSLLDAYQANEVRADDNYRGKVLRVWGRVARIGKDVTDSPLLELTAREYTPVVARFDNGDSLSSLMRGQAVLVRCRGSGMTVGSPMLDGCILDLEPPATPGGFIPDPGRAQKVTIDLAGKLEPPPADQQRSWIDAALAVRNHCRAQRIKGDDLGDLWNTATLVVLRNRETFVVRANFDDRRKVVHRTRAPQIEVDTNRGRLHALNDAARALCGL